MTAHNCACCSSSTSCLVPDSAPCSETHFYSCKWESFHNQQISSCVLLSPGASIVRWGGARLTIQVVNTVNISGLLLFCKIWCILDFQVWELGKSWICNEVVLKGLKRKVIARLVEARLWIFRRITVYYYTMQNWSPNLHNLYNKYCFWPCEFSSPFSLK